MEESTKPPAPSPLRGNARREAILAAATAIMTQTGAGRLTIGEVAKRASASKETVYRHFGDRNGLLISVLTEFAALSLAASPAPNELTDLRQGLERLGVWYLTMAARPEVFSFYRYVVGAVEENPELGKAFTQNVTVPIVDRIRTFLEGQGFSHKSNERSELYLGMLQGKFWNRALVEPDFEISPEMVSAQAKLAANQFSVALVKHGQCPEVG